MELLNADGSSAEMSGNGIRCLAQAVFQAGLAAPPVLTVRHRRRAAHGAPSCRPLGARTHRMSVDMGQAKVVGQRARVGRGRGARRRPGRRRQPAPGPALGRRRAPGRDELVAIGSRIDGATPAASTSRSCSRAPAPASSTWSCTSAASAPPRRAAPAPARWPPPPTSGSSAAPRTVVHMPGGPAEIALGDPTVLTGDVTFVAIVDTPWPVSEADRMSLIERSFREKIVLVGVTLPPATTEDTEAGLDELSPLVDTAGADEVGAPRAAPRARPIRPPTSARARPRSCARSRWPPTATPSCSTTSSRRRSSATSRSCSAAPPSTAPR